MPSKSLKTKKIQVDLESHDHGFKKFEVKNEFKDDHAFKDCENHRNKKKYRNRYRKILLRAVKPMLEPNKTLVKVM